MVKLDRLKAGRFGRKMDSLFQYRSRLDKVKIE